MKTTRDVVFSCALGSLIGAFVALAVIIKFHFNLWWVIPVPFVSAGAAYLTYDVKRVWRACRDSWQEIKWSEAVPAVSLMVGRIVIFGIAEYILGAIMLFSIMFWLFGWLFFVWSGNPAELFRIFASLSLLVSMVIGVSCLFENGLDVFDVIADIEFLGAFGLGAFYTAFFPILMIHKAIKYQANIRRFMVSAPIAILKMTKKLSRMLARFVWRVFVLIHSSERVIVFTDTFFGTVVGFLVGYTHWDILLGTLAGGVAGAILGYINYVFVSVCWLKLIPKTVKA